LQLIRQRIVNIIPGTFARNPLGSENTRTGPIEMPVFVYGGTMLFVSGRKERLVTAQTADRAAKGLQCWAGSLHVIDRSTVLIVDRLFRPWGRAASASNVSIADDRLKDAATRSYVPIEAARSLLTEIETPIGNNIPPLDSAVLIESPSTANPLLPDQPFGR
jgi:hypothetical protein